MAKRYTLIGKKISIHALREEGDAVTTMAVFGFMVISIHALREEGDPTFWRRPVRTRNFYPRPPRGGRRGFPLHIWRSTEISIHALREEGDSKNRDKISIFKQIVQHSARI